MKFVSTFCLAVLVAFSSVAIAQESGKTCSQCPSSTSTVAQESGKTCGQCPSSTSTVAADADDKTECSGCPVAAAMGNLPKMTYKVGDEAICCSESAAAMAKEKELPMHYVVAEKSYDDKQKAFTALVETTETFVKDFVTPAKCEKSGKTSIAGKSCGCPVEAGKNTELVKAAISDIKMTYVVGEEKCNCPMKAKELASKGTDVKTTFVVAGEETCCNLDARLKLAKAKYAAAVKALAKTEKKEAKAATSSDS